MPHAACSVCQRPDVAAIDAALKEKVGSVRGLAKRFGIHGSALHRHLHHDDNEPVPESADNTGEIARIRREIYRLGRAETAAKRRRDTGRLIQLSREKRAWHQLLIKAEGFAAMTATREEAVITHAEAISGALVLVEAELASGNQEVLKNLCNALERVGLLVTKLDTGQGAHGNKSLKTVTEASVDLRVADPIRDAND